MASTRKKIQIAPSANGPYIVKDFTWDKEKKKLVHEEGSVAALCRCGRSRNKVGLLWKGSVFEEACIF